MRKPARLKSARLRHPGFKNPQGWPIRHPQIDLVVCAGEFYPTGAMDISKYPIEKLVYFAAGIFPGFNALLIYELAVPGAFAWFFAFNFLGYRTKLSIIVIVAFVIGNSLTTFLSAIIGSIGGTLGGLKALEPYKPPQSYDVAPWRDPRWRTALKNFLGDQAPNDSHLIALQILQLRRASIEGLPAAERSAATAMLEQERIQAEIDEGNWAHWYDHFHQVVLTDKQALDLQWHVHQGLAFNLETTALYVLVSVVFVPSVRHWWCVAPSIMWVLILFAREYTGLTNAMNKWSTLSDQTEYLMAHEPMKESVPSK